MQNFNADWINHAFKLAMVGNEIAPRGKKTKELLCQSITIDMRHPVLTIPGRKLNYKFMAAEAYWILSGDDKVENISPFCKNIAQFSDDGERFFGAYGPKIQDQLPYVVEKLTEDPFSRQAGLTIWRENPPATKDVPCTISIFFSVRDGLLHVHANMRSSDVWLGLPYDVFNFSMLGHLVCALINQSDFAKAHGSVRPGNLCITMTSSHLYDENREGVDAVARELFMKVLFGDVDDLIPPDSPAILYSRADVLMSTLKDLRTTEPGDPLRWWEGEPK